MGFGLWIFCQGEGGIMILDRGIWDLSRILLEACACHNFRRVVEVNHEIDS